MSTEEKEEETTRNSNQHLASRAKEKVHISYRGKSKKRNSFPSNGHISQFGGKDRAYSLPSEHQEQVSMVRDHPDVEDCLDEEPRLLYCVKRNSVSEIRADGSSVGYGHLTKVSPFYACYDPMQYPLLFPAGENGYYMNMTGLSGKDSSPKEYLDTESNSRKHYNPYIL
ncbi:MAG: hypothetical protein SGCHY_003663 [Lobulomycetales sp.]